MNAFRKAHPILTVALLLSLVLSPVASVSASTSASAGATTAAQRVVTELPFRCGQVWDGNKVKSSRHTSYEIDFNLQNTSGDQDKGQPVLAAADGRVELSARSTTTGYGNYITIRHPDGSSTLYAHLDRRLPAAQAGRTVRQGVQIGTVGNTTRAGASPMPAHLHFEHRDARNRIIPAFFNGRPYRYPSTTVTSRNACRDSPSQVTTYTASADLDGRLTPDPARHDKVDLYLKGARVIVDCQTTGRAAYGSMSWALTSEHLFVPAALLRRGTTTGLRSDVPACRSPKNITAEAALDARSRKEKGSPAVTNRYAVGASVPVVCTAYGGPTYGGRDVWARTSEGRWVVRAYLKAAGDGLIRGLPRCDLEVSG